jgi:predicted DNA-binding antitoxin AbrB/MazE fold protein
MSQEFHAIYEHGILRPLAPLNLPESAAVIGVVRQVSEMPLSDSNDPLLGLMANEPELVDLVLDEAMQARESHPLRAAN